MTQYMKPQPYNPLTDNGTPMPYYEYEGHRSSSPTRTDASFDDREATDRSRKARSHHRNSSAVKNIRAESVIPDHLSSEVQTSGVFSTKWKVHSNKDL